MNYFIKRDLNEYGPYSLADLQKYVASGNILLTDLCRSEGLTDWVPVSQVIGNIPVPAVAPQPVAGTVYGGQPAAGSVYGGQPAGYGAAVSAYPAPPNLHWALVLLIAIFTCGIFSMVWLVVEGVWLKKVMPNSKGVRYLMAAVAIYVLTIVLAIANGIATGSSGTRQPGFEGLAGLAEIVLLVVFLIGVFAMRSDIEEHFNTAEPIGLSLSGVMTFFFSVYYFQYHFSRINEMKRQQMGYPR